MRLAILGGGNCYALELARHALKAGHEVMALGRSPMREPCFSLEFAHPVRGFQYHQAPLGYQLPISLLDDFRPEWIVSFAAQGEGAASFTPDAWAYFYQTNVAHLVDLCGILAKRSYLRRFVQIGTSELYGSVTAPADEDAPLIPSSPYADSKAAFDRFLMIAQRREVAGFPINIVRPSNCYVPGQQLHRIIPRAMLSAALKRRLPLQGGGVARKSYLHAADLARAILRVCEDAPLGMVYNVGPDEPTAIRDVVAMCAKHMLVPMESFVDIAPERTGQDGCYWLDSSRIKALGWQQEVSWDAGLAQMAAWVNAYKDDLAKYPVEFQGLKP